MLHGFTDILKQGKLIYRINHSDIQTILKGDYLRIKNLQINLGYQINDDASNPKQPKRVKLSEIYKYNRDDYHKIYSITYDECENILLVNPHTGQFIQFFMLVACNHCNLCFQRKQSILTMRAKLESTLHTHNPFFFDLTFSNEHYPTDLSLLNQTLYVQKFFRRLRKILYKHDKNIRIRYIVTSEYGSLFGRFHYHALVYGLDQYWYDTIEVDKEKYGITHMLRFGEAVNKAWQYGFSKIEVAKDPSGAYAVKYAGKSVGTKKTKHWKSINFGYDAVKKYISEIRDNTQASRFQFLIGNSVKELPLYKFIQEKVYPSLSRQLPVDYRKALLELYYTFTNSYNIKYHSQDLEYQMLKDTYLHYYNRYLNLLGYDINHIRDTSQFYYIQISEAINNIRKNLKILDSFDIDYDQVYLINAKRNEHILLTNVQDYDVDFLNYKFKLQLEKYKFSETDLQ
jgi:hypothetical protein